MTDDAPTGSVRIDKWLWAARCFKTRTLATAACNAGHVKVNGETARPARPVRPGDEVDVVTIGGRRILGVVGLGEKRGPATAAQALYDDHTPVVPRPAPGELPDIRVEKGGRPTKRDRRRLDRERGGW